MRVSELMQPQVWMTYPEESLADAAIRMRDHAVGSLAVVDGEELLGILTERDLLWAMADGAAAHVAKVGTYMSALVIHRLRCPVLLARRTRVPEPAA